MRIIGGEFGGRRLKVPKGLGTRPTPDRVREALFSVLGDVVAGVRVVELFGGTGSLGLEALSRGASHAVFFETGRPALACLEGNIRALAVEDRCTVHRRSAFDLPRVAGMDLVIDARGYWTRDPGAPRRHPRGLCSGGSGAGAGAPLGVHGHGVLHARRLSSAGRPETVVSRKVSQTTCR